MANIKSQIKRNRQNEARRLRNKAVRSELKTRVKTAVRAVESGAEDGADALRTAIKRLDKAAQKGVIHKNQAANRKSRLMRRVAALSGGVAPSLGGARSGRSGAPASAASTEGPALTGTSSPEEA
jgi:small subunit ribosomal protein S20